MTQIIDALKRLERTGSGNSKTTHRLIEAAEQLSRQIVEQFCAKDEYVLDIAPKGSAMKYSIQTGRLTNADSRYVAENRETALAFATDVADGLLDAITETLEKRKAEAEGALGVIEAALRK